MNIFYLDKDPARAAAYHCDKHVVKMILESCQLLSNAMPDNLARYKRTHVNHPCSKWVQESPANFAWLCNLTLNLLHEWSKRYGKPPHTHKCYPVLAEAILWAIGEFSDAALHAPITTPPQCMPDEYRHRNTVKAYRAYYKGAKAGFATWRNGAPEWWADNEEA